MSEVILAGICLKQDVHEFDGLMAECRALCAACGRTVAAEITQQSESFDRKTAFRSGKLQELAALVKETNAEAIVFANDLSVAAGQRIEETCGVRVIDRTALILDIFSLRSRTRQAKLQVEMARLQYALPRLSDPGEEETHERGGSYRSRGSGEQRSAQIRITYRKRIRQLQKQLAELEKQNWMTENRRSKSELSRVALTGYTNAGKSSLLNAMLRENAREGLQVPEKDMLFATLDTSVRQVSSQGRQFLLYDTVGFVSRLPHTLIDAFHSTLDAARHADLLLHVIDASDPQWEEKAQVTEETLQEIGAGAIKRIRVFTKSDLGIHKDLPEGIRVSAKTMQGIPELMEQIADTLYPEEETLICHLPYSAMAFLEESRRTAQIEILEEGEQGLKVRVSGPKVRLIPFHAYREERYEQDSMGKV